MDGDGKDGRGESNSGQYNIGGTQRAKRLQFEADIDKSIEFDNAWHIDEHSDDGSIGSSVSSDFEAAIEERNLRHCTYISRRRAIIEKSNIEKGIGKKKGKGIEKGIGKGIEKADEGDGARAMASKACGEKTRELERPPGHGPKLMAALAMEPTRAASKACGENPRLKLFCS